jgi:GntR family carbon starvation induced transcriptional regulator
MEDTSITARAYQHLRADLISCRLKPSTRLNISALQSQLSLSQAAVREALSRLTSEGLIEIQRHRGFCVAPVSTAGFRELTQALLTVELPCLRSSILNADVEWELNLVSTYHRAVRTLELVVAGKKDLDAYSNARLAFYEALLAPCDNSWLLWSWRLLYAQNMRYRHLYMPLAKFELELNPHHEAILKVMLSRDVEKAVALSIENYARVTRFIETCMSEKDAQPVKISSAKTARNRAAAPTKRAKPALRRVAARA